jgi:hypothetical protein
MKYAYLESTPDNIAPEFFIPICLVLWVGYWLLGSEQRREARKARLKK